MAVVPKPFQVAVPDEAIADLKRRLSTTRYPGQLLDVGWKDGTEKSYLEVFARCFQLLRMIMLPTYP